MVTSMTSLVSLDSVQHSHVQNLLTVTKPTTVIRRQEYVPYVTLTWLTNAVQVRLAKVIKLAKKMSVQQKTKKQHVARVTSQNTVTLVNVLKKNHAHRTLSVAEQTSVVLKQATAQRVVFFQIFAIEGQLAK
jgi:hypothetical protein